jgi:hypothetical protein
MLSLDGKNRRALPLSGDQVVAQKIREFYKETERSEANSYRVSYPAND